MSKYSVVKVPSDILVSTAQNVSELRKERGWTQLELSERSGVSYGSVKRFERFGKISFESLLKIAEVLNRLEDFEKLLLPKVEDRVKKLFNSKK